MIGKLIFTFPLVLVCQTFLGFSQQTEPTSGAELKATLSEWVETERQLSRAQSEWRSDKATLEFDLTRMSDELKFFKDSIASLKASESATLDERESLIKRRQGLERIEAAWRARLPKVESRILNLSARFPAPLIRKIQPALQRIQPEATRRSGLNGRLQAIVAILGEADQFHQSVHVFDEAIALSSSETIQARTVFIGLSQAYYVNERGDQAGIGSPGKSGWTWTSKPELAERIQSMIDIQSGQSAPAWVTVPLTLELDEVGSK